MKSKSIGKAKSSSIMFDLEFEEMPLKKYGGLRRFGDEEPESLAPSLPLYGPDIPIRRLSGLRRN